MARRLRIQFGGALYHVINRGNYRLAVFGTVGSARAFIRQLAEQAARSDERDEFAELCTGWAIETAGWKRAVAKDLRHLALDPGYAASQLQEIKQQRWRKLLDQQFVLEGKLPQDAGSDSPDAPWKIDVAVTLRRECVPYAWISQTLAMGGLSSIRGHVFRREL